MNPLLSVTVLRKTREAEGICSFELGHADGRELPAFDAGAHIDIHVPGGLVRQYSLYGDASDRSRYRIAVLRDAGSRGGSQAMHDSVRLGDALTISEPRNHFPLVPLAQAGRTLLFAGGIGITPLLCMARSLAKAGATFELHCCTRSKARTAFLDELLASPFAANVKLHFDDGDAAQKLDLPALIASPDARTHLYVCGPAGFMQHVVNAAKGYGWPAAQVHTEYFGAPSCDSGGEHAFTVRIASTGQDFSIPPGASVTGVLAAAGIAILTSCEQGVCGTCLTRVLAGECEHRDLFLSDEEKARNDQFTPCCSRAKSPLLVLDL